jgi:hypothetical protein
MTHVECRILESRALFASYTAASAANLIAQINAPNLTPEADTITLAAGNEFSLTAVESNTPNIGPTGLPIIAEGAGTLTILGNGNAIEGSNTGTPSFRLFEIAMGASLTLQSLTLQGRLAYNSQGESRGGAIHNLGSVTLQSVTLRFAGRASCRGRARPMPPKS